MNYSSFFRFALVMYLSVILIIPTGLLAQKTGVTPQPGNDLTWPRVHQEGTLTIFVYQPQIDKWDGNQIEARLAVGVQAAGGKSPVYGVVWMHARAEVDKAARVVTMWDFKLTKGTFPTEPSKEPEYLNAVSKYLPQGVRTVALDHLEASFAISQAVQKARGVPVKNEPPRIIFSTTPALLIPVDGQPVLRPIEGQKAERVINTQAIIVKIGDKFYLRAMNYWYEASQVEGPWAVTSEVPASLEALRGSLVSAHEVDLIEPSAEGAPPQAPPAIYVSTVPTELIQSDGPPDFLPIEGTQLLQVKNSDDMIFMDLKTNDYYVLISGRWFKSKSLNGPWAYVPGKELPKDFAKISSDHSRANALLSVPGTPQAQEAVIANSIPQTSTVKRSEAKLEVPYDGKPRFEPIEGTPLQYAVNSPLPVVQVDTQSYYCVQNGVWFVATSPSGPWAVATSVPAVIYSIPPSSPLYYITYVRIYGYTPEEVYEGYTPGYLGTVVSPEGVVVYGTGYYYPPYIGTYWIGWPYTYGFGAEFGWGVFTGFSFGFAAGVVWGVWEHPWWGPVGWGWHHGWRYTHVSLNHVNIYNHWGREVALIPHPFSGNEFRDGHWTHTGNRIFNPYSGRRVLGERSWDNNARRIVPPSRGEAPAERNNVFGGRNGEVYRYSPSTNWQQNTSKGWEPAQRSPAFQSQNRSLDEERGSRNIGQQRFNTFRSFGGFRGGGRRR